MKTHAPPKEALKVTEEWRFIAIGARRDSDKPLLGYDEALNEIQKIIVRYRNEAAGTVIVEIIRTLALTAEVSTAPASIMDMRTDPQRSAIREALARANVERRR